MKYKKSISVIMPTYNSEEFIAEAIKSILNQSYEDFELIIIDDCSNDSTKTIIKSFKDSRIVYLKNPINKGPAYSRNLGISKALGKYMCMMDSDDVSHLNRLYEQFHYLENHRQIGCIGSAFQVINENGEVGNTIKRSWSCPELKIKLLMNCFILQSTIMIRTHLIKKHKLFYDVTYRYADDYDFFVRSSHLFNIKNIDKVLLSYRVHKSQISNVSRIAQKEEANRIRWSQIERLNINGTENELSLHMKLMGNEYMSIFTELEAIEEWCNKLLEANYINKLFNQEYLYRFFENITKRMLFLSEMSFKSNQN